MSAFASITLVDSAAANVVFTPQSNSADGVATWLDNNSVLDAKRRITMSVTLPKNGSRVARAKQKVIIPIMDSVDATKKIDDCYAVIEYVFPKTASLAQRLDAKAFVTSLTGNAVTTAAATSLESIY